MGQRCRPRRRRYVYRFSPAGQSLSSTTREEGETSLQYGVPKYHEESANACVIPISPVVRNRCEPPGRRSEVMGVDEEEEEVEEGRVPRTRKFPDSMSVEELRAHSLTHIPYHPRCKCCVAGRKRDHQHPLAATSDKARCKPTWRRLTEHQYARTTSSPGINPGINK